MASGGTRPAGYAFKDLSELPRAHARGIITAKLRLPAGVLSSGYFHPQAYACGITM